MLEALQTSGFMDGMKIHGWADHNGYHEKFAERAKKAAAARWKKAADRKGEEKEKTGEDKRREEKSQALLGDAKSIACSILAHLRAATGRPFRETDGNLALIRSRLAEPEVTADGCRQMIDRQVKLWKGDNRMEEFLRPITLFGKEKFGGYYDTRELPVPKRNGEKSNTKPGEYAEDFTHLIPADER